MFKRVILLLLLGASALFATEVKWAEDYTTALKEAKAQNKPIMFIYSRHTCKYCIMLEHKTLSDARVIKGLNRDYISVVSYSDENDYIPRELWRPGTPTIWFLKPDGEPMFQPIPGYVDADNFLTALAVVMSEFKKRDKK